MSLYWTNGDKSLSLYCGDARDILSKLPEKADVIIADPPYGQTSLAWDKWQDGWVDAALEALADSGSMWCFGTMRMFMKHAGEFSKWKLAQDLVWEKHNGSNFHKDRFRRVHESIVQFYPVGVPWGKVYHSPVHTMDAVKKTVRRKGRPPHMGQINSGKYESHDGGPRLMRSVIRARSTHGYAVHHTQKPVNVILPLLKYSCPPGGLVLDLFAGSCSTMVAAQQLGFRAVGIEIDAKWLDVGIERLVPPLMRRS